MTCLQQPWEGSLKPPLVWTAQPHSARGCSLPPDTVKSLKPTGAKDLVAKSASGHPRERDCFVKHLAGPGSSLHQLKTLSQMQNFVFKKVKLLVKRRDPSKESLQTTQMLVWLFCFISQANSCSAKFLTRGLNNRRILLIDQFKQASKVLKS